MFVASVEGNYQGVALLLLRCQLLATLGQRRMTAIHLPQAALTTPCYLFIPSSPPICYNNELLSTCLVLSFLIAVHIPILSSIDIFIKTSTQLRFKEDVPSYTPFAI